MPVISIDEKYEGCGGSWDIDSGTMSRLFQVAWEGSESCAVMAAQSRQADLGGGNHIPKPYEAYPGEPWAYADAVTVSPTNSPKIWDVKVNYTDPDDPLAKPNEIAWSFATSREPIDLDFNGDPILNSAKETYDPATMLDIDDIILRVKRNTAYFNPVTALDYKRAVNSVSFYGFDPGIARCKNWEGTLQRGGPSQWYSENLIFQFRKDGWKRRKLDQGFRSLVNGEYKQVVDKAGKVLSEPSLLDGAGVLLAAGATPVYNEHEFYTPLNFNLIGV
jgi:hypothetical protein